jgi:hypothetical protein
MPEERTSGVEVWRDLDNTICALGETRDDGHWIHFPRLASFRFSANGPRVDAIPYAGASIEVVRDTFTRTVLPLALQALGREVLHASGFVAAAGVVAFCAVSETGKSTLARAIARRGLEQWADDAVAFEVERGRVVSPALPFAPRLHEDAVEALGDAPWAGERSAGASATLAAAFLLERAGPDQPITCARLAPAEAFPLLLEHAYCFSLADEDRKRRMMDRYLDFANLVPVFALRYPTGFAALDGVVDAVLATVGSTCEVATLP